MDVDDVGLWVEVIIPNVFEQHRAGDDLLGVAHQIFEQLEFPRLQCNLPLTAGYPARHRIHVQVTDREGDLAVHALRTAIQRVQAGEQFAECKGLGQIIIAAAAQAANAVIDLRQRTQD